MSESHQSQLHSGPRKWADQADRKREERAASKRAGLTSVRISLTRGEATLLRAKAEREGWGIAFSDASRRAQAVRGDLAPLDRILRRPEHWDASQQESVTAKSTDASTKRQTANTTDIPDLPGQSLFWPESD